MEGRTDRTGGRKLMGLQLSKPAAPEPPAAAAGGQGGPGTPAAFPGASSPIGVPISVVVTQEVILSHHLVSGDFQRLVDGRQEIFTQAGDLAEREGKAEQALGPHAEPGWRAASTAGPRSAYSTSGPWDPARIRGPFLSFPQVSDTNCVSL